MKKLSTICAAVTMILVLSGVAQASLVTYSIVDYPTYQIDVKNTGSTDHVSGTIIADPSTGVISSASFTITGGDGTSYTVASATISTAVNVSVTPTQITLSLAAPDASLKLSGSTGVSGSNGSAELQWYTPAQPWMVGTSSWARYHGLVGSLLGSGGLFFTSDLNAIAFTAQDGSIGSYNPMVVATAAPVPIPSGVWLLGSGLIGLVGIRRRSKK